MKIVSLFTGAGGLDLGFHQAGFNTVWANEFDKKIHDTFRHNFPKVPLCTKSITDVEASEIPSGIVGLIGGPPCQSWSEAGKGRGIKDNRGQLFYEYIRILNEKRPLFFLAENVSGMLADKHAEALENIKSEFVGAGYTLFFKLLDAVDYGVPQNRKRVFFIGFREDLKVNDFEFPEPSEDRKDLADAIWDLKDNVVEAINKTYTNEKVIRPNHEYMVDGFSSMYMSRNRVRKWTEPSFTIQASGRHAPLHPQAPTMPLVKPNVRKFVEGKEELYRRLSVRECARIQTFPDDFIFKYKNINDGYKMVGNAVPVRLAYRLAMAIKNKLSSITNIEEETVVSEKKVDEVVAQKKSNVSIITGGSTGTRDETDFYPTPTCSIKSLINYLWQEKKLHSEDFILEPCAGDGQITHVLYEEGFTNSISTDLHLYHPRKMDVIGYMDFLDEDYPFIDGIDWIITNPPYDSKILMPIVEKCLNVADKGVAMFLKLTFLETIKRAEFFKKNGKLKTVLVMANRQPMYKRGIYQKASNAIAYAWYIWDTNYNGLPTIDWIDNARDCKENRELGIY